MKPALAKAIYKDCIDRGYILHGDLLLPPAQAAALGIGKPMKKKRVIILIKPDGLTMREISGIKLVSEIHL